MKLRLLAITLLGLASFSCDKARSLANKARSAMESEIAKKSADSDKTKVDPALEKLVDRTPEGVVFRKDIPFPARLDVKVTRSHEINGRVFESSILGNTATTVKGTQTTVTHLERAADQVRYTLEGSTFSDPVVEGDKQDEKKKPVVRQLAPPSKPRIYKKTGSKWIAENSEGFRTAALAKELSPVFDLLLEENLLAPRRLWLGRHRIKIGTEIPVTGDMLSMLVTGKAHGSYILKFESTSGVNGHPCGVFSIKGDYSRKGFPDFEGNLTDEDVTVESGKIWLSLLYPIVLREEMDTIQTFRSGASGSPASRTQGTVRVSVIRDWKTPKS
ncbi:MAG: hypothetical protein V4584_10310 [Verrucomicrobiota bacterium]